MTDERKGGYGGVFTARETELLGDSTANLIRTDLELNQDRRSKMRVANDLQNGNVTTPHFFLISSARHSILEILGAE
jgi:hypothetical protein